MTSFVNRKTKGVTKMEEQKSDLEEQTTSIVKIEETRLDEDRMLRYVIRLQEQGTAPRDPPR